MSQSLTLPRGYKVRIPLVYSDDLGRPHAPFTAGKITVDDAEVVEARLHDDSVLEIEAKEPGQTAVTFRVGEEGEPGALMVSLMVLVTDAREEGELPVDGPARVQFDMAKASFEGTPRPADPEKSRLRERRQDHMERALTETQQTDQNAARQDEERRKSAETKSPEQVALEARGPVTSQNPSGPELANRLQAESAGRTVSVAAGATADRPQDNPDDPNKPHNFGNQGGGSKSLDRTVPRGVATPEDVKPTEQPDDKKAQSPQQRGGASSPGTPISSPGSRRG